MENFPQTYEPTGSQSILEQFVGLKNFMNNKLNSNDYLKTIEQTLTEEQKAQARENIGAGASTINVIDNLSSQSSINALSANQGRVLNEKIESNVQTLNQTISQNANELQQDIDANGGDIASLQGDVSELNQEISRTLKTPLSAPNSTELVGINANNSQVSISAGKGISIDNGVISGSSIKLLWTNPKMDGSAFNSQTITLPTSDFDFLLVKCSVWNSNTSSVFWSIISEGRNNISHAMTSGATNDTQYEIRTRGATVNGASVTFGDTLFGCKSYGAKPVNENAVPLQIYGVKGV